MDLPAADQIPKGRRSLLCGVVFVVLAIVPILVACVIGSGSGGRDWAFELPSILLACLISLVLDLVGAVIAIVGLAKSRGRDQPSWALLAASVVVGAFAVLAAYRGIASSASV